MEKEGKVLMTGQVQVGGKGLQRDSGVFGVVDPINSEEQLLEDVHEAGFRDVCHGLDGKRGSWCRCFIVTVLGSILIITRTIVFFRVALGSGGFLWNSTRHRHSPSSLRRSLAWDKELSSRKLARSFY